MDINSTKIGHTHSAWSTIESTVADVRMGIVKTRMLTGTYLLQTSKHKFSKSSESATCKCCGLNDEDISHMLLDCPALHNQRKLLYLKVRDSIINLIGINQWRNVFQAKNNLVKCILDCSIFPELSCCSIFPELSCEHAIRDITRVSSELCYRLHLQRVHKLKQSNSE